MPKLISNIGKGRGAKAPALLARPKALLKALLVRLGRSSRGYVFLSAGVVAATVAVVSLLTFLAPDSDRPFIGRPVQAVQSVLPGVLEQVEGGVAQAATLLGVDQESVQNVRENLREGLAAAHSGSISDSGAPTPGILPAAGTATTTTTSAPEEPSSSFPVTDEALPPPQTASEPSAPSSGGGAGEASAPAVPAAAEAPPPTTTSEPTSPSVTEEPSPPPPPAAEEPPAPPKDEPAPPTAEEPPPPVTNQPEA